MGRPKAVVARMAFLGAAALVLGASMLTASLVIGGAMSPAFADTTPYELYCPGTSVGNLVLNDVVTKGAMSIQNPSATPFGIDGFQMQLTLPAPVISAMQSLGATAITGSMTLALDAGIGVQPPQITAGPFNFDVPFPSAVPPDGVAVDIPPAPTNLGGFFATPFTIGPDQPVPPSDVSVTVGPPMITLQLSGTPDSFACSAYANDTIAVAGITTQTPIGSTIAPVLSQATPGPPDIGNGPYYLALGDSVPMWNGVSSYPYDIAQDYGPTNPTTEVMDLACSGETTQSMLSGPTCAPAPFTSQMQEAVSFLQQHASGTALITIDIGGNDVVNCVSSTGIDQQCVTGAIATMETNLTSILTQLRQAAGPSVPIIGMNYFDPFLGDWLAGGQAQTAALATVPALSTLNSDLAQVYSQFDVSVADVFGAFHTSDLTDMVTSPWGTVPVAVNDACTWLDITCAAGQLEGFGDDPVPSGAHVIAQAFEQVIGSTFPSPPTSSTSTSTSSTSTSTSSTSTSTSSTSTSTTSTSTTSTSTTTPTTSSTSTPTASSTSTSTTPSHATSTTTHVATRAAGSPPSSNGPVTAPSSALAFTGTAGAITALGMAGAASIVVGVVLLLLVDAPRRVLRRAPRLSRTGSRRAGG